MRTMGADIGLVGQNSALSWGVANLALDAAGALPCQFPLQRGERALERISHKPSLPICNRIKRVDGLRRRAGVELHRPSGAMDPRRASRRGATFASRFGNRDASEVRRTSSTGTTFVSRPAFGAKADTSRPSSPAKMDARSLVMLLFRSLPT